MSFVGQWAGAYCESTRSPDALFSFWKGECVYVCMCMHVCVAIKALYQRSMCYIMQFIGHMCRSHSM